MKSFTTTRFRKLYQALPVHIQQQARKAYRQFKHDPFYPGLHFKQINAAKSVFSARINNDYRVLGIREDDEIVWFWIGSHADYDKLISQM